jgi:hypothetical protein
MKGEVPVAGKKILLPLLADSSLLLDSAGQLLLYLLI